MSSFAMNFDVAYSPSLKQVTAIVCCNRRVPRHFIAWHLCLMHGLPELLRPVILGRIDRARHEAEERESHANRES